MPRSIELKFERFQLWTDMFEVWALCFGSRKSKVRIQSLRLYTQVKVIVKEKTPILFLLWMGSPKVAICRIYQKINVTILCIKIYSVTWPQVEKLQPPFRDLRTWDRLARDLGVKWMAKYKGDVVLAVCIWRDEGRMIRGISFRPARWNEEATY